MNKLLAIPDDQYISVKIDNFLFGMNVKKVQDVIYTPKLTYIPLSSSRLCGLLNLRGRIVTAIDLGLMLSLKPASKNKNSMSVILEFGSELYSLVVDSVGEVFTIHPSLIEKKPSTLDDQWRQYYIGVSRIYGDLMVILDERRIFFDLIPNGDIHE